MKIFLFFFPQLPFDIRWQYLLEFHISSHILTYIFRVLENILSQLSTIRIFLSHFFKIHFNIIHWAFHGQFLYYSFYYNSSTTDYQAKIKTFSVP
jgi:hypothetical protein